VTARDASVIWHEVECGGYTADLGLWEALAEERDGPILDLGCGTGRVALYLARRGHEVLGMDRDPAFVAALSEAAGDLRVEAQVGDARDFALEAQLDCVIGPMQLVQLFAGPDERIACLRCVAAHLAPGGVAAFAIVESMPEPLDPSPPLPDTREVDGWVFSSLPVDVALDSGEIRVRRLRQTVSPAGELSDELDEVLLQPLAAATLEREAEAAGLSPAGRRSIPATDAHVGSTAVLLAKEG